MHTRGSGLRGDVVRNVLSKRSKRGLRRSVRSFLPCRRKYRSPARERGTGRDVRGARHVAQLFDTSGSDHRMSGLIGRLISHLAQKYIVEALGSASALSEPEHHGPVAPCPLTLPVDSHNPALIRSMCVHRRIPCVPAVCCAQRRLGEATRRDAVEGSEIKGTQCGQHSKAAAKAAAEAAATAAGWDQS